MPTAHVPIVGGEREAHINWSMVTPEKAAPGSGTTLRTTVPAPTDSRQYVWSSHIAEYRSVNAIDTQLRGPINSRLTRWRMAVEIYGGSKYMEAAAEIERNPVSKHQIQPECGEWAGSRGTGPVPQYHILRLRERGQGKYSSSLFS